MNYQLADLFEALCDAAPDAPCLLAGPVAMTRAELDARANRLAHYLIAQGVRPGDHIGIYAHNRAEWMECLFACWKLRAVAININFRYVTDELRYMWSNADLKGLVYERRFVSHVDALRAEFPELSVYLALADDSEMDSSDMDYESALASGHPERNFPAPFFPRSDDDVYMMYTGGTTGMPKGVMWRHYDFYHNVICLNEATDSPQSIIAKANNPNPLRSLVLSPLMHGGGQFPVLICLLSGGVACVPVSRSFDAEEILTTIQRHGITMLSVIGDAMARPLAEKQLEKNYELPSLAIISSGGALLTAEARALLKQAFGEHIFYTGGIGGSEIGNAAREAQEGDLLSGPRFTMNPLMAVLDDDLNRIEAGSDEVGWLAMRGFIPLGYYNDAEKTAEVFKTDQQGTRWVIAGDRARVEADGTFALIGRDSQCINSGGEKIFVEEVERAVASFAPVKFCAVVGVPDPKWQQRVVAVVECKAGESVTLEALQQHCRQFIAGYKIPRQLLVCEFRRMPNGKIDYRWAKELALQNANDQ